MGMEFDFTLGHYVEQCTKLGIFIDFDGTLSPLARTPELAFIPPETKKVSHFSTIHNGAKEFFRTCNVLPFNCTHLPLWRGTEAR